MVAVDEPRAKLDAIWKGQHKQVQVWCKFDTLTDTMKLVEHPKNPNKHPKGQIQLLAEIILGNGWRNPIKVSQRSGYITGGHGRLMAAKLLDMDKVPVDVQYYATEADEYQDLVADNRIQEFAEMDDNAVADLLEHLKNIGGDIRLAGYTDDDLDKLLKMSTTNQGEDDGFDPDKTAPTLIKRGDVVVLGRHRVLCGDCTDGTAVDKLFDGKCADIVVTDPPYGVDYVAKQNNIAERTGTKKSKHKEIANDSGRDYLKLFVEFLRATPLADYNTVYVFMLGSNLHNVRLAMDEVGITWGDYLIWVKDNFTLSRKDYHPKHEFIAYGWKNHHKFYGGRDKCTVLNYPKPKKSDLHPTMKPVELVGQLIVDGCDANAIVYDAFLGSGTTLVAAEQNGRTCYGTELEEHYCDVIVQRYIDLKGTSSDVSIIRDGKQIPYEMIHNVQEAKE